METSPSDRLSELVQHFKTTPNAFASNIGVDPSNFNKMLKGQQKITGKTARKICAAFRSVSPDWLLSGEGEMLLAEDAASFADGRSDDDADYQLIPLINIDSVGGAWSENRITAGEQYVERMIPFPDARPDDVAIYQTGDSMSPAIPAGAILQIRKVEEWWEYFGYGNDFVLFLSDDRRITKQILRYDPNPKEFVICHSYNPAYGDEELPTRMIRQVWKVINVLTYKGW